MSENNKISKLSKKLKLKDFKLNSLLQVTKAINNNLPTNELLGIYQNILCNELTIEKLVLFIRNVEWKCALDTANTPKEDIDILSKVILQHKSITVVQSSKNEQLSGFDVVIPVVDKNESIAYLLIGDLEEEDEFTMSPIIRHLPFIQTITNFIAVAIENKRLLSENLAQEVLKKELEVAAQMQSMLIPSSFQKNDFVEIEGYYQPHGKVGGDYYDYLFSQNSDFVFCISDISGKGVSAGLLMSNFQANLRAIIAYNNFSLEQVITELNTKVLNNTKGEKFITFFIGKYNVYTKELEYINAGHNPPMIWDGKEIQYLNLGCTILGIFDKIPSIQTGKVPITSGSILLSFTDGVPELENNKKEMFGTERLETIIKENANESIDKLNQLIIQTLEEYRGEMDYPDDTALLTCRFL